jgi:hypothetical protein
LVRQRRGVIDAQLLRAAALAYQWTQGSRIGKYDRAWFHQVSCFGISENWLSIG